MVLILVTDSQGRGLIKDLNGSTSVARYGEKSKRARRQAVRAFHQFIERFPSAVIRLDSESHGRLYYADNKITGDFVADVKPEVPCDIF